MWTSIKGVGNLKSLGLIENVIDYVDDLLGKLVKVENRGIRVEADGMKLIAILP